MEVADALTLQTRYEGKKSTITYSIEQQCVFKDGQKIKKRQAPFNAQAMDRSLPFAALLGSDIAKDMENEADYNIELFKRISRARAEIKSKISASNSKSKVIIPMFSFDDFTITGTQEATLREIQEYKSFLESCILTYKSVLSSVEDSDVFLPKEVKWYPCIEPDQLQDDIVKIEKILMEIQLALFKANWVETIDFVDVLGDEILR